MTTPWKTKWDRSHHVTSNRGAQHAMLALRIVILALLCAHAQVILACDAGYGGDTGRGDCTACAAGKYKTEALNGSCTDCVAGTYGNATGSTDNTSCIACTANSNSPARSTAQSNCTCNAGFGGDAGTGSCTACVAGKYKNQAGNGDCTGCGAGKYGVAEGKTNETSCTACIANSFSPAQSSARAACTCNAGYGGDAGTGNCTLCVVGTYKSAGWNGDCTACAANSTSEAGSDAIADCQCIAGFSGNASDTNVNCTACVAATYKDKVGNTNCKACPSNSTSAEGSTFLNECICNAGFLKHENLSNLILPLWHECVPCLSYFKDTDNDGAWDDFNPEIIIQNIDRDDDNGNLFHSLSTPPQPERQEERERQLLSLLAFLLRNYKY